MGKGNSPDSKKTKQNVRPKQGVKRVGQVAFQNNIWSQSLSNNFT